MIEQLTIEMRQTLLIQNITFELIGEFYLKAAGDIKSFYDKQKINNFVLNFLKKNKLELVFLNQTEVIL